MKYRYLLILILLFSCKDIKVNNYNKPVYSSKGFAYIYTKDDLEDKIIKKNINSLSDWKNFLDLVPSNYIKSPKLKKTGIAGFFAASLELTKEGIISIMQDKNFQKILIKSKK